jgi:hypothetical protein
MKRTPSRSGRRKGNAEEDRNFSAYYVASFAYVLILQPFLMASLFDAMGWPRWVARVLCIGSLNVAGLAFCFFWSLNPKSKIEMRRPSRRVIAPLWVRGIVLGAGIVLAYWGAIPMVRDLSAVFRHGAPVWVHGAVAERWDNRSGSGVRLEGDPTTYHFMYLRPPEEGRGVALYYLPNSGYVVEYELEEGR